MNMPIEKRSIRSDNAKFQRMLITTEIIYITLKYTILLRRIHLLYTSFSINIFLFIVSYKLNGVKRVIEVSIEKSQTISVNG